HLPQDIAARTEELVCVASRLAILLWEVDQQEVADRGRDAKPELRQLFRQPLAPLQIVIDGVLHMLTVAHRSSASFYGKSIHVEGPAHSVERIHHMHWPIKPANPHRSEEHTSELQSRENLVCRLLLEK